MAKYSILPKIVEHSLRITRVAVAMARQKTVPEVALSKAWIKENENGQLMINYNARTVF